jgi:DNA-directed RNA polymerase subunit RPC12/RpoP
MKQICANCGTDVTGNREGLIEGGEQGEQCPACGIMPLERQITHEDTEECGVAGLNAARREREDE